MSDLHFKGVFPILVTPFTDDEHIDLISFERVVDFMAQLGFDGVTIFGVLGKSNRLIDAEREALIQTAIAASDGRIPIVVGTSHPGTHATLRLSQRAEELGASGVMIAPSKENVPNEARIFEYFHRIAAGLSIPIVAQDHPASTGVHMSSDLILRQVEAIPHIAGIKQEAVPTPPKTRALLAGFSPTRRPTILTGLGALYGRYELESSADGFMTGFAFPEGLQALVAARNVGDDKRLCALYERFLPLIVFEQQPGVAVRKEIFRLRGLLQSNCGRHPGCSIDTQTADHLQRLLNSLLTDVDLTTPLTF